MLLNIQSSADIHTQNLLKVIMFTIEKSKTYRKELAEELSLSAGTVSALCNKLVSLGLATERKHSEKNYGAKVKIFAMSQNRYCLAMLDIHQVHSAELHILSLDGNLLSSSSFPIAGTIEGFLVDFSQSYSAERAKHPQISLIGMGVSVSATMHQKSGRLVTAAAPVFEGVKLQSRLEELCQIPVLVENESVLCSIASVIQNKASGQRSIYLFIGEGTGIGVVVQNNVICGDNGLGSDICNILSPHTRQRKTVEEVLSSNSDEKEEIKGKTLGYLLSILINLFDINIFYIGGPFAPKVAPLLPEIDAVLDQLVLHKELRDIKILPDPLYAETMRYGALAMIMSRVIKRLSRRRPGKQGDQGTQTTQEAEHA